MADLITVRSLLPARDDDGFPVALYEADDQHPANAAGKHEAFVAGPDPVEVARTGLVNRRISEGALEIVERPKAPTPARLLQASSSQSGPRDLFAGLSAAQRTALTEAGYTDADSVRSATGEELEAVDGVGPVAIATLRANTEA